MARYFSSSAKSRQEFSICLRWPYCVNYRLQRYVCFTANFCFVLDIHSYVYYGHWAVEGKGLEGRFVGLEGWWTGLCCKEGLIGQAKAYLWVNGALNLPDITKGDYALINREEYTAGKFLLSLAWRASCGEGPQRLHVFSRRPSHWPG